MNPHSIALFIHLASVVAWVGGMFFAYVCLRPAAVESLEPPARLTLWVGVFRRFFPAVWASVGLILLSGLFMLGRIGMGNAPINLHAMLALGLVMIAIYCWVFFVPYRALVGAVAAKNWPAGGAALGHIRQWVGTNLLLGALTVAVATLGRGI